MNAQTKSGPRGILASGGELPPICYRPLRRSPAYKEWLQVIEAHIDRHLSRPGAVSIATLRELRELEHFHKEVGSISWLYWTAIRYEPGLSGPPWWSNVVFDRMPGYVQWAFLVWEPDPKDSPPRRLRDHVPGVMEWPRGAAYELRRLYEKAIWIGRRYGTRYTADVEAADSRARLRQLEKAVYVRGRDHGWHDARPAEHLEIQLPYPAPGAFEEDDKPVNTYKRASGGMTQDTASELRKLSLQLEQMRDGTLAWDQDVFERHDYLLNRDSTVERYELLSDEPDAFESDPAAHRDRRRERMPDPVFKSGDAVKPQVSSPKQATQILQECVESAGVTLADLAEVLRRGRRTEEQRKVYLRFAVAVAEARRRGVAQAAIAKEYRLHTNTIASLERVAARVA